MHPIYIVSHNGTRVYDNTILVKCLRYIGTRINGNGFGALNITVGQAMEQGYSIYVR